MKMRLGMRLAIGRSLMKSHGVWEGSFKEIVVAYAQMTKRFGQRTGLGRSQFIHRAQMPDAEHHDFKGPHRPKGNQDNEILVAEDNAFPALDFQSDIIAQ